MLTMRVEAMGLFYDSKEPNDFTRKRFGFRGLGSILFAPGVLARSGWAVYYEAVLVMCWAPITGSVGRPPFDLGRSFGVLVSCHSL